MILVTICGLFPVDLSRVSISFNPDQTGKASIKNSTPNRHEDILVIKEQLTAQFLFKILPALRIISGGDNFGQPRKVAREERPRSKLFPFCWIA